MVEKKLSLQKLISDSGPTRTRASVIERPPSFVRTAWTRLDIRKSSCAVSFPVGGVKLRHLGQTRDGGVAACPSRKSMKYLPNRWRLSGWGGGNK